MNILLILHALVVVGFTLRILMRSNLSPPARLAWIVVLGVLPVAGTVVYFLFGEDEIGKTGRAARTEIFDRIRTDAAPIMGNADDLPTLIDPLYQPAFAYCGSINGFYPMAGNTAQLMADAADTRRHMIADIDAASDHVHVLFYIWLEDDTGTDLAEALMRAAQRGVTCRAMADGMGSRVMIRSKLWQRMADAGVQLAVALPLSNPVRTMLFSRIDLRNHRKITVIDGAITYCGSRNSADPEFRVKAKFAPWVDIMVRFQGPVVAQNQLLFASDWIRATGEKLDPLAIPATPSAEGFAAQVMGDGPTERHGAMPQLFSTLLANARREVTISTPYFVPDATVMDALCATAKRGVSVTLIFPMVNDSWIVAAASHSYYRRLVEAGCVIHEFTDGLLHAKTLTIDGKVSMIGSSNLDLRSFDLNYENNILLQDAELTRDIRTRQQDYISRSAPVTFADISAWPFYRVIWNNIIATIGPVL
ncbi:cardiolipin synthase [Sulfitobacter sp. F26169L]|uniref:cardiolipin synthase n=1 Tax=Sulfitobacter sp. F26169L TaxID=2996015 RepID=UPI00226085EC|nr:cardiolipin synthase [Sulfitobacter sp. F26169L]MCX7568174.1 cardiolipin synthase [Sulfitobacter sp. F26169L]